MDLQNDGGVQSNVFVSSFDTSGNALWATSITSSNAQGRGAATDPSRNVVVVGNLYSNANFYNSDNTQFGYQLGPASNRAFIANYNSNGMMRWFATTYGASNDQANSVACDLSGNSIVVGTHASTLTQFYNANGTLYGYRTKGTGSLLRKYDSNGNVLWVRDVGVVSLPNADDTVSRISLAPNQIGGTDAFIVKYSTSGTVQWATSISNYVDARAITTDSTGVYAFGLYSGSCNALLNSDGSASGRSLPTPPSTAIYLVKYNTTGNVQWSTTIAGNSSCWGLAVTSDSTGIYAGGFYTSSTTVALTNGDGTSSGKSLPISVGNDAYIVKYSTSGAVQWYTTISGTGADWIYGVATDSTGVYATGAYRSTTTVALTNGDGTSSGKSLPISVLDDSFIVKYSISGTVQWYTIIPGDSNDSGQSITTDSTGVYVTGAYRSTTTVALTNGDGTSSGKSLPISSADDTFIVKYSTSGAVQWYTAFSGDSFDAGNSITADSTGVYAGGYYNSSSTIALTNGDGTASGKSLPSSVSQDAYIVKYSTSGAVQWYTTIQGNGSEATLGLTVDSTGIYATGSYYLDAPPLALKNGDGTTSPYSLSISNSGYVIKYSTSGTVQWRSLIPAVNGGSTNSVYSRAITTDSTGVYASGSYGLIATTSITTVATDSSNNIVVAGTYTGHLVYGGLNSSSSNCFLAKYTSNGIQLWSAYVGNNGTPTVGNWVTTDSSNNIYVTGNYSNSGTTTRVYNASGTLFSNLPVSTNIDVYTVKYDTNGNAVWVKTFGGTGADSGNSIAVDSNQNVLVSAAITPVTNVPLLPISVSNDAFIVKYSTSGTVQWYTAIQGTSNDQGYALATDSTGVYVTGRYLSTSTVALKNGDGTASGKSLPITVDYDAYIVKYSTTGTVQWYTAIQGNVFDLGYGLATDSTGVYATGFYYSTSTVALNNGDGTASGKSLPISVSNDAYIVKYSTSGTVQWYITISGTSSDSGQGLATDSTGVYATGYYTSTTNVALNNGDGTASGKSLPITVGSGLYDAYIVKYSTSGTVQWYTAIQGTSFDQGLGIATDSTGVYAAGYYTSTTTLALNNGDGTSSGKSLPIPVSADAYIVKYSTSGTVQWYTTISGTSGDYGYALATDSTGVYVTGRYLSTSTVALTNGDGTASGKSLPISVGQDAYIVKYSTSGTVQWYTAIQGTGTDYGYGLATDSTGVYATGYYTSTTNVALNNGDGTASGKSLPISVTDDSFIVKYSTSGTVQWVRTISGTGSDQGLGIATDSTGVYATGYYTSTTPAAEFVFPAIGAGLSNIGNLIYTSNGVPYSITQQVYARTSNSAVAARGSNFYIATTSPGASNSQSGLFYGLAAYSNDATILQVNQNGINWGTTLTGIGGTVLINALATGASNVVATGVASVPQLMFVNSNVSTVGSYSHTALSNVFIAQTSRTGAVNWAARINTPVAMTVAPVVAAGGSNVYVGVNFAASNWQARFYNGNNTPAKTVPIYCASNTAGLVAYSSSGTYAWDVVLNTDSNTLTGVAATTTSVYVTGHYTAYSGLFSNANGTAFAGFQNASATVPLALTSDIYLAKYNSNGVGQWATTIAGFLAERSTAVGADSSGNVAVTGWYQSSPLNAYNANGTVGASVYSDTLSNGFVARYNSDGTVRWMARGGIVGYGVACDSIGNTLVAGVYTATCNKLSNADGTLAATLTGSTASNVFVSKYDTSGSVSWVTRLNDYLLTTTNTSQVAYIIKYNTSGTPQWVTTIQGTIDDQGYGLATDSTGVYATGYYNSSSTVALKNGDGTSSGKSLPISSSSTQDAYIVKYSTSGTVQWYTAIQGTSYDAGRGLATDSTGVYASGGYTSTSTVALTNGDGTSSGKSLPISANYDVFIVKYSTSGAVQWYTTISGTSTDIGYGIATDSTGVYVTGYYNSTSTVALTNGDGTSSGKSLPIPNGFDVFIVKYSTSGAVQWYTTFGGTSYDAGFGVATDSTGVYATGYYNSNSTVALTNGDGTSSGKSLPISVNDDAYIVKYSTSGTVQWQTTISGTGYDYGQGLATDSTGVYAIGWYNSTSTVALTNGDGTSSGKSLPISIGYDGYIVKYSTSGTVQWATAIQGTGSEVGYGITTDSTGVYATGYYNSSSTVALTNGDGTSSGKSLPISVGQDAYIVKYSTSGAVQWYTTISGTGTDTGWGLATDSTGVYATGLYNSTFGLTSIPTGMAIDASNNALVTGYYNSNLGVYGVNNAGTMELINMGGNDCFVAKYTPTGAVAWGARISGTGTEVGYGISSDASQNVIVTGSFTSTPYIYDGTGALNLLPRVGSTSAFTVTFDSNGVYKVSTGTGGAGFLGPGGASTNAIGYGCAGDALGNATTVGLYNSSPLVVNYMSYASNMLPPSIGYDAYIVKYSTSGTVQWYAAIPGTSDDFGRGLATDSTGVYATGYYQSTSTVALTNGDGTSSGRSLPISVADDAYIVKYSTSGTVQWYTTISTVNYEAGFGLATDSTGVYATGYYRSTSTVALTNGDGTSSGKSLPISVSDDGFIVKYSTSGAVQWYTTIPGTSGDGGQGLATDSTGVYATGYYNSTSTVALNNGDGTASGKSLPISVNNDAYIVKYSTSGTVQWYTAIQGTSFDQGLGIATDSTGVYATGLYQSTSTVALTNGDGTSSGKSLPITFNLDAYIVKYSTSGTVQWYTAIQGTGYDYGQGLATDSTGVYATGAYNSTSTVALTNGDGTASGKSLPISVGQDAYIVKYSTSGTVQWYTAIQGTGTDYGYGLATDSTGVYATGYYISSTRVLLANGS